MEAWIWILIPLAAILVGAFKEWLKFRAKQRELGTSTEELERIVEKQREELEASRKQQEALVRRIQNLEAIVATQVWDVVHDHTLSETERERRIEEARLYLEPPPEKRVDDTERVAQLARRLKI